MINELFFISGIFFGVCGFMIQLLPKFAYVVKLIESGLTAVCMANIEIRMKRIPSSYG